MSAKPPIRRKNAYNQQLSGVFGEFGSGAGLRAFYVQSSIAPPSLAKISLLSDIPGSERWPIRELFQRDVDNERVTNGLLPYLQDVERIKFFNPLTLTVLPLDETSGSVLSRMPRVVESTARDDDADWRTLEREGFYRVRWIIDHPEYARLEWNDNQSRLVAIDGQHRLSALKRLQVNDAASVSHQEFLRWRIPIVVVSFRAGRGRDDPPGVLDVVRSIFVHINKTAQKVNVAREILLSDDSINSVCTQELLQHSHANDTLAPDTRNPSTVPLFFFDWRGEEHDGQRVHSPAAVKTIEEVHAWLEWYILGEDFTEWQEIALGVVPTDVLKAAFHEKRLNYEASDLVRERFRSTVLPGLLHLLERFRPYQRYIAGLRELERAAEKGDDLSAHAFDQLRFGSNRAPEALAEQVRRVMSAIGEQVRRLKDQCFHELIEQDIGMRGVIWAFAELHNSFGQPDWLDYSAWFTDALNRAVDEEWIDLRPGAKRRDLLHHIAQDHNETVVNYRLEHAGRALGPYVALLVGAYGLPWPEDYVHDWQPLRDEMIETLLATVTSGYKKQVRPELKEQYPNGGKELTAAVKGEAERRAGRQLRRFERQLDAVVGDKRIR